MKHLLLLTITAYLISCTGTDKPGSVEKEMALKDTANYTTIEWLDSVDQNIGKIEEGQVVEITWQFRNSGNKPLVVARVTPGCGCTGAEGPSKPIAPGKEGKIKAIFDSKGIQGTAHKTVTMVANNSNHNAFEGDILKFSVDIVPKK